MGTWGLLAFDNDDANDWAYDLKVTDDLSLIEQAFEAVESAEDYVESPDAANALAACEVLARLKGNPGYTNAYTRKVDEWVAAHAQTPSPALLQRANAVIDRVLADDSELNELWSEVDAGQEWVATVEDLRRRVIG